ncbi:MAG: serine hydrolase domain-containing protein [Caulobacteraceae bacterium]
MLQELGTGMSEARLERITDLLERRYVEPGKIAGCQALVARRGRIAYRRSFGRMDIARAKPMADDAILRIYSMTKPITSLALMMLFERGLFQLDEPVRNVLPEWGNQKVWISGSGEDMEVRAPDRPVSFRDLLRHTSGLTYGALLEQVGAPPSQDPVDLAYKALRVRRDAEEGFDQFTEKLGQVPLKYQPGTRWMYSLATDVCGVLVERLSGRPFAQFLQAEIFQPLGMVDTAFHVPEEKAHRFAANYGRRADKTLALLDDPETSAFLREPQFHSGGGGLVSTLEDYRRFCEMLRRGGELDGARLVGPRTLALMHKNHLAGGRTLTEMAIDSFSETASQGVGFGLGFAMTQDEVQAGSLGQGDYYWGGAASTIFWVDPAEDMIVIFLTQLMPSTTFNFRGQLKNIIYSSIES